MALHVYIDENSKAINKVTFSILKNVETESHSISVYPLHQWAEKNHTKELQRDVDVIYNRIMGTMLKGVDIKAEYELEKIF